MKHVMIEFNEFSSALIIHLARAMFRSTIRYFDSNCALLPRGAVISQDGCVYSRPSVRGSQNTITKPTIDKRIELV